MAETILLIDDEEMILDSLSAILLKDGYQVDCAKSGNEALEILRHRQYDLIITDIRMPGISGLEMVENLKTFKPDQKILVITGYGSLETAVKAQHRGVSDYLIKPIDVKSLKNSIRRALKPMEEAQAPEARHLDKKLKDWMEYFSLISDFTSSLNASLDVREIIDATLDRLRKIAETEFSSLYLFSKVIYDLYYLKNIDEIPVLSAGTGICVSLAESAQWISEPILFSAHDGSVAEEGDPQRTLIYQAMARDGIRQAFLIPVIVKGRIVGIADVCTTRDNSFSEIDINLSQTLINQTSLALAKALSYLEMEERSKEIGLLYNLSLRLNQSLKITDSIKAICEGAVDITGAAGSLLQTSLEPGSVKNFIFHRDFGFHKEMKRGSHDWLIPQTARKEAFFSNDPVMDPRVNSLALYSLGIRSLAYVPLIYEWEDIGGLTVFYKTEGKTFDDRDLHLLHLFARHASEVLLNSQLFEAIKKSREKIITEKNKMDIVLGNMADGVVTIDNHCKITYINEAMLKMFGIRVDQAVGKLCHEVFTMDRCKADCPVRGASADPTKQEFFESAIENEKHESMPVYVSLAPIHDSEGKVDGWVKVVKNMDKIKELEKLKDSFFHAIAHDLRAPLSSIMGFTEILSREDIPQDKRSGYLKIMENSASEMNAIIDNLLDVYRSKNAGLVIRNHEIDMQDLVQTTVEEMEGMARKRGVALHGFESGGAFPVRADEDLIKRVLSNLVSNAIKNTPGGGSVRVWARMVSKDEGGERTDEKGDAGDAELSFVRARETSGQPSVEISVEDTGVGIAHGELEKIFDKFYKVEHHNDTATPGSGLGLAITKEIVEAHGGKIWAENVKGGGTKFIFILPQRDAENRGKDA
jgi:PAS domain S-box-containing protein